MIRDYVKTISDERLGSLWRESEDAEKNVWIPEDADVRKVLVEIYGQERLEIMGSPILWLDRIFSEVWRECAVRGLDVNRWNWEAVIVADMKPGDLVAAARWIENNSVGFYEFDHAESTHVVLRYEGSLWPYPTLPGGWVRTLDKSLKVS